MNQHPAEEGVSRDDLLASLLAADFEIGVVEPGRLLRQQTHRPIQEFVNQADGTRLVGLPQNGVDASIHRSLEAAGVPVLRAEQVVNDVQLLRVPPGTRPLGSMLHLVTRYQEVFEGVFYAVGGMQGRLLSELGGMYPPYGERVVDGVALAPMGSAGEPPQLLLTPPYNLGEPGDGVPEEFGLRIYWELADYGIADDVAERLAWQVVDGVRQTYYAA